VIEDKTPPVRCDAAQLLQIIMNLVINARDALQGRSGRIELRSAPCRNPGNTAACITISDNGAGIDPAIRERIFEPFFTTRNQGTGLGLSTVHDIVIKMGGNINVDSDSKRGTVFSIKLPAVMKQEPVESSPLIQEDQPVKGCVLVVDDEPMVREASIRTLEQNGIEVRAAADAEQALAILEELGGRAAILVTDVVMPGMGGRELATEVLALYPDLPVLYITGYTDDTVLRHGLQTESVNLLRKPYSPQVFINLIKRTIASTASRRNAG